MLLMTLRGIVFDGNTWTGLLGCFREMAKGNPNGHLWYLYMIIWLYLFTPWIIHIKQTVSSDSYDKFVLVYFVLCFIFAKDNNNYMLSYNVGKAMLYMSYYLMGELITRKANNLAKRFIFGLGGRYNSSNSMLYHWIL